MLVQDLIWTDGAVTFFLGFFAEDSLGFYEGTHDRGVGFSNFHHFSGQVIGGSIRFFGFKIIKLGF